MEENDKRCILVCQNCSCLGRGSQAVLDAFTAAELPENVTVVGTDCQGQCNLGPTVRIVPEETWYCQVEPADIAEIVEQHLQGGEPVKRKLHPRIHMRYRF